MENYRFYSFWIAQTSISLADVVYIMVITTYIYQKTESILFASLFPFLKAVTRLIAGLSAPLILQNTSMANVLVNLQITKAILITLLLLGFTFLTSHIYILLTYILILSFVEGWGSPLLNSIVPKIVLKEELVKANSLLSISNQAVQIGGYTLTGFIVVKIGYTPPLLITAVLLWVSIVCLYIAIRSLYNQLTENQGTSKSILMKEGWIHLWNNATLRFVTLMDVIEGIAGQIWVGAITLVYVKEILHKGEQWWGYINASYYIGTIVGGIITIYLAKKIQKNLVLSMAAGSFLFSVLTLLYGLSSMPLLSLILCIAMGPAYQIRDVAQQTAFQTNIDVSLLPKVYASRDVLLSTVSSISIFIVGVIAEYLGIRVVYMFGAALICISAGVSFVLFKTKNTNLQC
ncbi:MULTISPECIES: MFS transporter [unclassified Bacillus (in: firmicutes)]|uniref:MFS transporter n=1 Tax=unclassified Bacillus (in: firmicutes) TaxID=185979 RepID=UPI0008F2995D|nr:MULTISPECIES: MFS transporter [unclassified Bacillus (in: firmicutes)]SFI81814.1 Major Facilitator Superfamily protein [Bacillus sp. 71mf]SFS84665.1 Major Facilitator Superfamily protein [Bacillus sp. 103mf]